MARLTHVICLLGFHSHSYRERRNGIQHYVCARCGHATPVVARTQDEHQRVLERGQVSPLKATSLRKPLPITAAERARTRQALGL